MKQGISTILLIVIIVAVGIIGAVGGYYCGTNSTATTTQLVTVAKTTAPKVTTTVVGATTTAVDTANWKTYENTKYGYKIKYPSNWYANYKFLNGFNDPIYLALDTTEYQLKEAGYTPGKIYVKVYPDSTSTGLNKDSLDKTIINGIPMNKLDTVLQEGSPAGNKGDRIIKFYFTNGKNSFEIGFENNPVDMDQLNQILSTFTFTKS